MYLLLGGIKGFPRVAHQPTGWTIDEHRLTQKSLVLFWPNPSYLSRALYPASKRLIKQRIYTFLYTYTTHKTLYHTDWYYEIPVHFLHILKVFRIYRPMDILQYTSCWYDTIQDYHLSLFTIRLKTKQKCKLNTGERQSVL